MALISWLKVLKVKSLLQFDCHLSNLLNNTYKQQKLKRNQNILCYSVHVSNEKEKKDNVSKEQVNTVSESKITLLLPNNSMTVTYLKDAKKLAKDKNLELTKVEDEQKNSSRDTYKLIQPGERYLKTKNNDKENDKIKTMKQIQISSRITVHDLNIKLKNINKLLSKNYKIKLIVNHNSETHDKVLKYAELNIKQYGTIQKTVKSLCTTLTIIPILNEDSNENPNDVNVNIEKK
ncbi:translation initiation factor IF-3-like [Vespa mandarinia]|uniref:translation initiation factor IF-3-like n=1 Tax=Vespa mandarinia TaxID=7446 RepID=UPI001609F1DC|nr:translation initiation factor IF-3-like [Vespa mandarinia]